MRNRRSAMPAQRDRYSGCDDLEPRHLGLTGKSLVLLYAIIISSDTYIKNVIRVLRFDGER